MNKMKVCIRESCSQEVKSTDHRTKYCSRSCAATVNNKKYPKRGDGNGRVCKSSDCRNRVRKGQRRYCSTDCRKKLGLSKIKRWLDGESFVHADGGMPQWIRTYLLEETNYQCSKCNWSGTNPRSGKSTLTIDHVDGDSENNVKSNLRVLCPNCHSLTPTYGNLNRGNGRKHRYANIV